jgi:hypothetical protein
MDSGQDLKKQIVVEWVLTNGKLPGFEERLRESYPYWSVAEARKVVYRAQGGEITYKPHGSPGPGFMVDGIRGVIATSKTPLSTLRYAGKTCCIFAITLMPGTRYLDVDEVLRSDPDATIIDKVRELCPTEGVWPSSSTSVGKMLEAVRKRCSGRVVYRGTGEAEYIPAEQEIMVYALDGGLSRTVTTGRGIYGRQLFKLNFGRVGGCGRTFRSKTLRRNKNGRRPTRKSQNRRDCEP